MKNILYLFLIFLPVSIALEFLHADPLLIFITSSLSIIPLAWLMGRATENLSVTLGAGLGGFLNASLGNAAELIIATIALKEGLHDVVKASITGSIIGNILLVLGLSFLLGGIRFEKQRFNATGAGMGATLLLLSATGLILPALFHYIGRGISREIEYDLSLEISIILFVTYLLSLIFSLKTHRHIFNGDLRNHERAGWGREKALSILIVSTIFIVSMSEFLVGALKPSAERLGMTEVFIGVILVAIIGNAAEHSTAVLAAIKDKMDLALSIAIGSSIQVALFVAPLLVFIGSFFGSPMNLVFTPFEVTAVTLSVVIVGSAANDGESHWMEGVMLISTYLMLGVVFYFLP